MQDSHFQDMIETMVIQNDFSSEPERIFELVGFLDEAEVDSVIAVKQFLLKTYNYIDEEFIIKLLSLTNKTTLSSDTELLELFKNDDDVLLFLKL